MSERQKRKKAKELEKASMTPKEPPTKLQKAVTHWLRKNVPTKKTKFLHAHVVEYFAASKAIGKKEGCCMVSWYLTSLFYYFTVELIISLLCPN